MTCHTDFDINSGVCGCTVNLGRELEASGINVDYYTYGDLPQNLDFKIKHCLFPFFVYRHINRYRKWDIIDATTSDTWILGKLRGKNKKPKIVVSSHGLEHIFEERRATYEKKTSLRYKYWIRLHLKSVESSLKSADHICVLTHTEKEYIENKFSIPEEHISVSYHSLPAHFLNLPEYRSPNEFKILYVGGWEKRKGIRYLLEALENLCNQKINFSATLAGLKVKGSLVQKHLSESLKQRVKIIPFIENRALPNLYLSHSVFVFPSLYEGFGMVLAEAMACGVPVVTTEAGIAAEWIKSKVNGIVVPYQDSSAIYEALVWAFNHMDEMRKYGENAKKLIQKMGEGREARQRMDIYSKLLNHS